MQDRFSHPSVLEMSTLGILLTRSPGSLISLSPSHNWPPKETPVCSGGETMPSPGTTGSSSPVRGPFCCRGATYEIFRSRWSRERTDGRTPSQLALSRSFTRTTANFRLRPRMAFLFLQTSHCVGLSSSWLGRGLQRGGEGGYLAPFLYLISFG